MSYGLARVLKGYYGLARVLKGYYGLVRVHKGYFKGFSFVFRLGYSIHYVFKSYR